MAKASTTTRTTKALQDAGWTVDKVEWWNHFARKRKDLFGGIDLLAIRPSATLGVQATSRSNVSARVKKIVAEPRLKTWVEAGNMLEVWGWDAKGVRVVPIYLSHFA